MTRDQFDHAVRAAGAVLGVGELLVIGSQALHACINGALPPVAERSVEVDLVPPDAVRHLLSPKVHPTLIRSTAKLRHVKLIEIIVV